MNELASSFWEMMVERREERRDWAPRDRSQLPIMEEATRRG
jgi:hypothetical protein